MEHAAFIGSAAALVAVASGAAADAGWRGSAAPAARWRYWLDARHRRVALQNLTMCFGGEKSPAEIRALARENFRRIGENYASAVKTAAMTFDAIAPARRIRRRRTILPHEASRPAESVDRHRPFRQFRTLRAVRRQFVPGYQVRHHLSRAEPAGAEPADGRRCATSPAACFSSAAPTAPLLRAAMNAAGIILGLLADQTVATTGCALPFLGHDCSTIRCPGGFRPALQLRPFTPPFATASAWRNGGSKWATKFPRTKTASRAPVEDIMRDVNRAFEAAVRRDPANWFWVHRRWKAGRKSEVEDGSRRTDHEPPPAICHPPSPPHSGSRRQLAGRRRDDHARAAAAARKISRRAHRAARRRKNWRTCGGIIRR